MCELQYFVQEDGRECQSLEEVMLQMLAPLGESGEEKSPPGS